MEVEKLLEQSESKTLEFKSNLSSLDPVLKTIVAFANTAGGILIIGLSQKKRAPWFRACLKTLKQHPEVDLYHFLCCQVF